MPDANIIDRLRQVTHQDVPGIAIAIAGPEGLRETAAAGYADLAAGQPASAGMVCPWFSMTKIVTASLAMRLAGQGLLGLDQPVLPLVPELAELQPRAFAERITPRHLLLRDGELDGTRTLPAESAAAMRHITTNGKRYDLGLGWFRPAGQRNADPPFVEHLGGGAGFFNMIRIYPAQKVGITIMGNATNYLIDTIATLALAYT